VFENAVRFIIRGISHSQSQKVALMYSSI
jgi:hypothetical protein